MRVFYKSDRLITGYYCISTFYDLNSNCSCNRIDSVFTRMPSEIVPKEIKNVRRNKVSTIRYYYDSLNLVVENQGFVSNGRFQVNGQVFYFLDLQIYVALNGPDGKFNHLYIAEFDSVTWKYKRDIVVSSSQDYVMNQQTINVGKNYIKLSSNENVGIFEIILCDNNQKWNGGDFIFEGFVLSKFQMYNHGLKNGLTFSAYPSCIYKERGYYCQTNLISEPEKCGTWYYYDESGKSIR